MTGSRGRAPGSNPAWFLQITPAVSNIGGSMPSIAWLLVKSTALTIVLALLMFGWLRTVMTFTQTSSADRRAEAAQVQLASM